MLREKLVALYGANSEVVQALDLYAKSNTPARRSYVSEELVKAGALSEPSLNGLLSEFVQRIGVNYGTVNFR